MTESTVQPSPDGNHGDFVIRDCALIAIATGNRAMTLKELRDALKTIDEGSIYYHFWGGLLQPRFEEREYSNDFAAWAWRHLHDADLAERLAVIDPVEFDTLEALRGELLEIIEERLEEKEYLPWQQATAPFELTRSQIVVFDTHKRAATPEELVLLLPHISSSSIFYHFIDARRRLPHRGNDFSFWLAGFDGRYQELCNRLNAIDPYFGSLTDLKKELNGLFQEYFREVAR
ncbi:MAG: hypothetical protein C4531_03795 [Desulfurivibrio sp.]|nr:MAG: hypothetical protein C4531_03795 [Desulfurivibrio sp.]